MCSVDVTGVSNQPGCQGCGNPDSIDRQRGTQCCDTSAKCRPLILRGVESGMGFGEDFLEESELEMKRKRKAFQWRPLLSPFLTATPTREVPSELKGQEEGGGTYPARRADFHPGAGGRW